MDISAELYSERLEILRRHIDHVQESSWIVAERLIKRAEKNDRALAHELVTNVQVHDHSKFTGIEWLYLHDDVKEKEPELFKVAWLQHVSTNTHHPEYWHGIDNMPDVFLAEMVADWKARSNELGTDLRSWIKESATKKFKFPATGKVYKKIKIFVDLMLDKPFK